MAPPGSASGARRNPRFWCRHGQAWSVTTPATVSASCEASLSSAANRGDARHVGERSCCSGGRLRRRRGLAHRPCLRARAGSRHRPPGHRRDRHPVRRHRRALRVPPPADLVGRTRLAAVPVARHARHGAGAAPRRAHADDGAGQHRLAPGPALLRPARARRHAGVPRRDPAAGLRLRRERVDRQHHVARHLDGLARRGDAGRRRAAGADDPAAHPRPAATGDPAGTGTRRRHRAARWCCCTPCCSRSAAAT